MAWNTSFLKPDEKLLLDGNVSKIRMSVGAGMAAGALLMGGLGGAATGAALSSINGHLFLTNKRLVLAKHLFMMFGTKVVEEITLRMIDSVTGVPHNLYHIVQINTKDDKSHCFDVAIIIKEGITSLEQAKEKWIEKINEAIRDGN